MLPQAQSLVHPPCEHPAEYKPIQLNCPHWWSVSSCRGKSWQRHDRAVDFRILKRGRPSQILQFYDVTHNWPISCIFCFCPSRHRQLSTRTGAGRAAKFTIQKRAGSMVPTCADVCYYASLLGSRLSSAFSPPLNAYMPQHFISYHNQSLHLRYRGFYTAFQKTKASALASLKVAH